MTPRRIGGYKPGQIAPRCKKRNNHQQVCLLPVVVSTPMQLKIHCIFSETNTRDFSMHWVAYCPTLLQYQQLTPSPPHYLPVLLKNLTVSIIGQRSAPDGQEGWWVAGGGHSLFSVQRRTGQRGSPMKEKGSLGRRRTMQRRQVIAQNSRNGRKNVVFTRGSIRTLPTILASFEAV